MVGVGDGTIVGVAVGASVRVNIGDAVGAGVRVAIGVGVWVDVSFTASTASFVSTPPSVKKISGCGPRL